MLKIVKTPNAILTTKALKVEKFDEELVKLVGEMEQTLDSQVDPQGVGLAAPQVGKSITLFIMKPTSKAKTEVFINPRILKVKQINEPSIETTAAKTRKTKKKRKLEGCLSIGKIWGPVRRSDQLKIEYQDIRGKIHNKWFFGFKAVIIQHEIDHLNGILFTQRVLEQKGQLYEEKDGELIKLEY